MNNIGKRVDNKVDFLKKYKFSLAMENVSHKGYCTEKIIESFSAGTIPVYWGDIGVTEYFNERAFINCHAYSSVDEIINEIIMIDNNEEKYFSMLNEPVFINDYHLPEQQNIRFENWFISIFERKYTIRRNCLGAMKNYEERYRKQRNSYLKIKGKYIKD